MSVQVYFIKCIYILSNNRHTYPNDPNCAIQIDSVYQTDSHPPLPSDMFKDTDVLCVTVSIQVLLALNHVKLEHSLRLLVRQGI